MKNVCKYLTGSVATDQEESTMGTLPFKCSKKYQRNISKDSTATGSSLTTGGMSLTTLKNELCIPDGITNFNSSFGFRTGKSKEKEDGNHDVKIITTPPSDEELNNGIHRKHDHDNNDRRVNEYLSNATSTHSFDKTAFCRRQSNSNPDFMSRDRLAVLRQTNSLRLKGAHRSQDLWTTMYIYNGFDNQKLSGHLFYVMSLRHISAPHKKLPLIIRKRDLHLIPMFNIVLILFTRILIGWRFTFYYLCTWYDCCSLVSKELSRYI